MRVYELSKKMGVKSQEILAFAQDLNLSSKSQLANLNDSQIAFIKDRFNKNLINDRTVYSAMVNKKNNYAISIDKKYVIINPYHNSTDGISNYTENCINALSDMGIDYELISNSENLNQENFAKKTYDYISKKYGKDEVIIEAPEARYATLFFDSSWNVHIRLHCPLMIAQKYDSFPINQSVFSHELRVINKAKYVSCPSAALIDELNPELRNINFNIFANPIHRVHSYKNKHERKYDLIFFFRFQELKGLGYINKILESLPEYYKVALVGKSASAFIVSPNVKCKISVKKDHISSDARFSYLEDSKCSVVLSKFENQPMAILEALSHGVKVLAWNIKCIESFGKTNCIKSIPFENCKKMANAIRYLCENEFKSSNYPTAEDFTKAIDFVNVEFKSGFNKMLSFFGGKTGPSDPDENSGFKDKAYNYEDEYFNINTAFKLENIKGRRVLGISISNEHIEEMWMPIVQRLGCDYRFISRRPLGFMYKFNNPFKVDPSKYAVYDWLISTERLIANIKNFNPDVLLFFNGNHPMYQKQLNLIKETIDKPIIFSELGWMPQLNNIFFDSKGVAGRSALSKMSFSDFTKSSLPRNIHRKLKGDYILVLTQLENDTNMIIDSPRFKKVTNFVRYVISQKPDKRFIVKCHPLDKSWQSLKDEFESDNVQVTQDGNLSELFSSACAVCSINSSALIEALKYDVNIYQFGNGLLNNKDVVIDCRKDNLKDVWVDHLHANRTTRNAVLNAFKSRQVDVSKIMDMEDIDILEHEGLAPLLDEFNGFTKHKSKEVPKAKKVDRVNEAIKTNNIVLEKKSINEFSQFKKKKNKLKRNPYSFFEDSKIPLIKGFKVLFKKK